MINTQRRITEAEYRQLFGLSYPENTQNAQGGLTSRAQEALKYAHDIRKFEIRLYWTRAAYFWTFIVAALGGYGLVQEVQFRQPDLTAELSVVVGTLGFVFSLAWYCANRGSKRWQENWEKHVDLLEDAVIGPLYKIVFEPEEIEDPWYRPSGFLLRIERLLWGAGNFSVSKINQITSLFVTLLWSLMICRALPVSAGEKIPH